MSFALGTLSGALVAGGIYSGLSNLIQFSTQRHQHDFLALCTQLSATPSAVTTSNAPAPAAARIAHAPSAMYWKGRWNQEVSGLASAVRNVSYWSTTWVKDKIKRSSSNEP